MLKFTRIALIALAALFVAGSVSAAEAKAKDAKGTVVSYVAADTAKGTPAILTVKVGAKEEAFVVDAKTVLTGKNKKAVEAAALKAGEKVEIKFTEDAKKVMTAVSVTLQ